MFRPVNKHLRRMAKGVEVTIAQSLLWDILLDHTVGQGTRKGKGGGRTYAAIVIHRRPKAHVRLRADRFVVVPMTLIKCEALT
jgi:hypothetical protein